MPTRARLVALATAALLLLPGASAALAATDDGPDVTWGVRTASGDLGADRQNYAYTIDPGASVTDAVVVTNHDTEPLDLDLYGADGFTTDSGALDVAARDDESHGVGAWTTLATDHVTIDPGASLQVDFAVTVPDDAQPGDYAGAVVTSLSTGENAGGVSVERRLGVRIHLRVTGELRPALAVEDLAVTYGGALDPTAAGVATVTWTVRNMGNARLSAAQGVTVAGPFGVGVATADVPAVPELLPGETWPMSVTVDGVRPLVRLGATVTLEPSLPDDAAGPAVRTVEETASTWAPPWSALVLLAAAVGVVLVARRRRRRRRAAEQARVDAAVAAALEQRDAEPVPADDDRLVAP